MAHPHENEPVGSERTFDLLRDEIRVTHRGQEDTLAIQSTHFCPAHAPPIWDAMDIEGDVE